MVLVWLLSGSLFLSSQFPGTTVFRFRPQDRTVTVTGPSEAVDRAVRAIEEILQSERRSNHQPEHKKVMKAPSSQV